ncbi:class A beta-lactamase [Erwinia persicina]|uniref:class A beta-lactamase n=1 Tax=Erwinia persicina TaxID=55211 RepID=UPI0016544EB3|nr:class A beta-lactamase [Erwinia persicina]MBC3943990.1 class A beta-lactamase [Erwinia persicina]
MTILLQRRQLLVAGAALALTASLTPMNVFAAGDSLQRQLAALETEVNGRIGLSLIDSASQQAWSYRGDERFPLCSTFKLLLVAAVLKRSESQPALMQQTLHWTPADHLSYMPVTAKHPQGMTVSDLCAAALQYSDNLAANVLLTLLGGPASVTRLARSLGDSVTQLDRNEPTLNTAIPGDPRDTTTPLHMSHSVQQLLVKSGLQTAQQQQLIAWLKGNTTGKNAIAAALPAGWEIGDKTGSGGYGTTNDVAILWPPGKAPLILAIYFTQHAPEAKSRQDVLAKAAAIALKSVI